MRIFQRFGLSVLLFSLTACAYFDANRIHNMEELDLLIAEKEFVRAYKAIERTSEDDSDYQQYISRRKDISEQAVNYEKEVLKKTSEFMKKGDYSAAIDLYKLAEKRLLDDKKIIELKNIAIGIQKEKLAEMELELLISKSAWLEDNLKLRQIIDEVNSHDWVAGYNYKMAKYSANSAANELYDYGKAFLEANDLNMAKRIIPQALRLNENNKDLIALNAEYNKAVKRQADTTIEKKRVRLMGEFSDAFEQGDFNKARKLISQLENLKNLKNHDELVQKLRQQLTEAIDIEVQHYIEEGVEVYGQEQYEQAILIWRKVLELDPANEQITTHIERAERVIEKLQQLREKQSLEK